MALFTLITLNRQNTILHPEGRTSPHVDIALSEALLWLQQVHSLCGSIRLGLFNENSGRVPE
jgi:hypothetical protein